MASIYDTILREDPLETARREATARLEAQRQRQRSQFLSALEGLPPGVRQGAVAGEAAGQLLSGFLSRGEPSAVESSPEVARARQNADLVKSLSGLEADPASAEWATQAAARAKSAGRDDLALQLLGEAAQRRKAEAKAAREQQEKDNADWRATVNTLPSAQKYSLIVNDPENAASKFGLKGKAAERFVKDAQDTLDTIRQKNVAELNKIKPVAPANVTQGDMAAVGATLDSLGYDADAFNPGLGSDEQARTQFLSIIADQARTEQEIRARKGGDTLPLDQITAEIMGDLEAQGVFVKNPDRFGSGFTLSDEFNAGNVRNVFKTRINEFQGSKPVTVQAPRAPAAEAAPSGPEVPFVDFTQPAR